MKKRVRDGVTKQTARAEWRGSAAMCADSSEMNGVFWRGAILAQRGSRCMAGATRPLGPQRRRFTDVISVIISVTRAMVHGS